MAYTLGGVELPKPKRFTRNIVEKAVEHLIMFAKTTKKVENRKEQFILEYQFLTQAQVNEILSLYNRQTSLIFTVNETNLSISDTEVLMDIQAREYPPSGEQYRENLQIILTEIL